MTKKKMMRRREPARSITTRRNSGFRNFADLMAVTDYDADDELHVVDEQSIESHGGAMKMLEFLAGYSNDIEETQQRQRRFVIGCACVIAHHLELNKAALAEFCDDAFWSGKERGKPTLAGKNLLRYVLIRILGSHRRSTAYEWASDARTAYAQNIPPEEIQTFLEREAKQRTAERKLKSLPTTRANLESFDLGTVASAAKHEGMIRTGRDVTIKFRTDRDIHLILRYGSSINQSQPFSAVPIPTGVMLTKRDNSE